jgi:hypothetical protein
VRRTEHKEQTFLPRAAPSSRFAAWRRSTPCFPCTLPDRQGTSASIMSLGETRGAG